MDFHPSLLLFWLKKVIGALVLPPTLPLLPIVIGLILLPRWRRIGMILAWSGVVLQLLLIMPASVGWLVAQVEHPSPLDRAAARGAEAVVILGAGRRSHAPEFGGETVNRLSLERLRYGARLARESGLPVLVSGGAPAGGVPEALLMRTALEQDFRVPVRWVESVSRDTRENARMSAVQLHAAGVRRILLVTHAAHMRRASREFEAEGLAVIPAATAWLGGNEGSERGEPLLASLPSQNSAYAGWFAVHEWLGQLAYQLSR